PGQKYTFGVVKAAQARADFAVLAERGRRILRVHLGVHVAAGLSTLRGAVFDTDAKAREALANEGAIAAGSLAEVVKALSEKPRAVWIMLPAGRITEETVERLGALLERDDIIIDGGNTFYKDDIRRARTLFTKGIRYLDCGTSGGVWGVER